MDATDAKATLLIVVPNLLGTMSAMMHFIFAVLVATWYPRTQRETISTPTIYIININHIHAHP